MALLIGALLAFAVGSAVVANPGVPSWWPPFCLSYDVTAARYMAWLLTSGRIRAIS